MKDHSLESNHHKLISPTQPLQDVEHGQLMIPTWFIIVFLVIVFVILKKFIYTKDEKKHGK